MLSLMHYEMTYLCVYVLRFLFIDCSTRVKNIMSRCILIFDIFIYLPYRRTLIFGKCRITVSPYPYRRISNIDRFLIGKIQLEYNHQLPEKYHQQDAQISIFTFTASAAIVYFSRAAANRNTVIRWHLLGVALHRNSQVWNVNQ